MESGKENAHRLVSGYTIREEGLGVVKDLRTWSFRCELDGNIHKHILHGCAVLSTLNTKF